RTGARAPFGRVAAVFPAVRRQRASAGRRGDASAADGFRFVNGRRLRSQARSFCCDSSMLIICPNCTTAYWVETAAVGATGRLVRCVRCRNVWFARDPSGLIAIAESHRAALEGLAGVPIDVPARGEAAPEAPAEAAVLAADGAAVVAIDPSSDNPLPHAAEPITIADVPTLVPMEEAGELPADAKF